MDILFSDALKIQGPNFFQIVIKPNVDPFMHFAAEEIMNKRPPVNAMKWGSEN